MEEPRLDKNIQVKNYISESRILIVDSSSASQKSISKILIEMGATASSISCSSEIQDALSKYKNEKPKIIFTEYALGNHNGFDFLKLAKQSLSKNHDSLSIMVSGNSNSSVFTRIVEEDFDHFISKPYSRDMFIKTVLTATVNRIFPTQYKRKIDEGSVKFLKNDIKNAQLCFEEATKLNQEPSMAYSMLADTEISKKDVESAINMFHQAISYSKIHHKSLNGLYSLYMEEKRFTEALDVAKRIAQVYTANPENLANVLRLTIATEKFDEIDSIFQDFREISDSSDKHEKYICAALIVCAKHFFRIGDKKRAFGHLERLLDIATNQDVYLLPIIDALIEFEFYPEAGDFLSKFSKNLQSGGEYLSARYLIIEKTLNSEEAIKLAEDILAMDFHHRSVYLTLISKLCCTGHFDKARALVLSGSNRWKENRSEFQGWADLISKQ